MVERFVFLRSLARGLAPAGFRALALLVCLAGCRAAFAQSTGTIQGTVTDPSGAVVPGVHIVVRGQATGAQRTTQTNQRGTYIVPDLAIGTYRVTAQAAGFETQVAGNLQLAVGQTLVQSFALKVGTESQAVTVTGAAPLLNTTSMAVSKVISETTVQTMPLNGRHFVDLGLLLPGSVVAPQSGFLTAPLRGQGAFSFDTAGNREDTVNFMINGINLNDMSQNQITFQPPISGVAEFNATNSTFDAEYGRNSGAIVNIATRSGTNQFHGEAFEYLRNEVFDAKNFFDNPNLPIPPFKRNQFGGDMGGPILKNKLFFFGSYEGLRQRQRVPFDTPVPTAAERGTVTNSVVSKLLPYVPLPNVGTTTFEGSGSAPVLLDDTTADLSYRASDKDNVHGYYAFQRDARHEPSLQGNNIPGFGDSRAAHRQLFTFNETHIFGPQVVNEFRMGFNRIHIEFSPLAQINPASVGINDGISTSLGLPQVSVGGSVNLGGPAGFPQGRADTVYVWSDTLSYLKGAHSLKFGGEVRRFQNNNFNEDVGSMAFTNIPNFLAGTVNSFSLNLGGTFSSIRTTGYGLFAQDNYKVKPNFNLDLGLRWDVNTTPNEVYNRFVVFNAPTDSLDRVGTNGINAPYKTSYGDFGPRIGFAWQPFGNGKTVVRSGYGIYYDQPVTNSVGGLASNPPFGIPLAAVATPSSPILISDPIAGAAGAASSSPATINPNFRDDYVQEWNFTVQRQLSNSVAVQAQYIGSKATHLRMEWNLNQFELSSGSQVLVGGKPVRPYAGFSNIFYVDSPGNSSYNALWLSATKRFSHGLQINGSYSWSHSLDLNSLSSQGVVAQDSANLFNELASSDFDARNHFNVSYIYNLPFKGNRAVSGWEIAGITTFQSGNPFTIALLTSAINGAGGTVRPNLTGSTGVSNPNPSLWFNTGAFCVPGGPGCGTAQLGNVGRNTIIGPGFDDFDFSVIKNTKLTERFTLQFRTEAFNIFNNPNLGQPGRFFGTSTFGRITSTRFPPGDSGSARQIQFALRLLF